MSFLQDFKAFAFRGNVIDLAVGVVVGGAFSRLVAALVADVVMPIVALFMPRGDWRDNGWVLRRSAHAGDDVVLRYGDLLGSVLDFFIIAMVLFVLVTRAMRAAQQALLPHAEDGKPAQQVCPYCKEQIPAAAVRCRACTSTLPGPALSHTQVSCKSPTSP